MEVTMQTQHLLLGMTIQIKSQAMQTQAHLHTETFGSPPLQQH